MVRRACGLSRKAIAKGIQKSKRVSRPWKAASAGPEADASPSVSDPGLVEQLEEMIDSKPGLTRSLRCVDLQEHAGHRERTGPAQTPLSQRRWPMILHDLDYSLQSNRRTAGREDRPDRDAQFRPSAPPWTMPEGRQSGHFRRYQEDSSSATTTDAGQQWLPAKQR